MSDKAITWGKIKVYDIQDSDLDTAEDMEFPFHPGSRFRAVNTGIDEPSVQINYEDFFPGQDIAWVLPHDEVQYVVSGTAEIDYWLPPLMLESGTVSVKPGSIVFLPRASRVVWRVTSEEPLRHLCVCYPNPGYPVATAPSVA